ncbi:MAG: hypothetical protein K2X91_04120 [Thermoleophilia bacterium]|nr:hypothetical protein [Thermoleophilia bacterium]
MILPRISTTGRPLKAGATRRLTIIEIQRLAATRALVTVGISPREAWACSGVLDLGTMADLDLAVTLVERIRAAVYLKGAITCRD